MTSSEKSLFATPLVLRFDNIPSHYTANDILNKIYPKRKNKNTLSGTRVDAIKREIRLIDVSGGSGSNGTALVLFSSVFYWLRRCRYVIAFERELSVSVSPSWIETAEKLKLKDLELCAATTQSTDAERPVLISLHLCRASTKYMFIADNACYVSFIAPNKQEHLLQLPPSMAVQHKDGDVFLKLDSPVQLFAFYLNTEIWTCVCGSVAPVSAQQSTCLDSLACAACGELLRGDNPLHYYMAQDQYQREYVLESGKQNGAKQLKLVDQQRFYRKCCALGFSAMHGLIISVQIDAVRPLCAVLCMYSE